MKLKDVVYIKGKYERSACYKIAAILDDLNIKSDYIERALSNQNNQLTYKQSLAILEAVIKHFNERSISQYVI